MPFIYYRGGVPSSAVNFPLAAGAGARFLVDRTNRPFPIFGRASWGITGLSASDLAIYLDDCVAKGFTAIEAPMPCTPDGADSGLTTVNPNLPADANGHLPFLKQLDGTNWTAFQENYSNITAQAPDWTTPNALYWASIDALLAACLQRHLLVLMFPAYVGFQGTHQGWMDEMVANGFTKMSTYGTFVANRYAAQTNLVWLIGGDRGTGATSVFSAPELNVETGFVNALLSTAGHTPPLLVSAEWARDSIGPDQSTLGSNITLSGFYASSTEISHQGNRSYNYSTPALPSFCIEDIYDNDTDPSVRRFQWWATLSAIGGYCTGNDYVYPFDAAGVWKAHLSDPGTLDLQRLNTFWQSIVWQTLVPEANSSGVHTIITAGGGTSITSTDWVAAAADGVSFVNVSLFVAYVPPAHAGSVTINMTVFRGTVTARWFDPTNGTYTAIGMFSNTGTHAFTTPGTNSGGQTDWLLRGDA